MLWLVAIALGLVVGLVTGGSVDGFSRVRFRWPLVLLVAVVIREAALLTPLNRFDAVRYVYVVALAVIVVWTIWHFHLLPGVWLVTAGGALNLLVIGVNGARMPVAPALAGSLLGRGEIAQYTLMGPGTNLGALGDWISVPPFPEAYSPGDVVIAAGLALVVFLITKRPTRSQADGVETSRRIVNDPP
ncbi:MAG TPA: DUF5317 family protein [Candidatus Dormibacteraeota bacterium]|nr:DUF5317 family protein [Candidatus Dormibacteraeota bacterium]